MSYMSKDSLVQDRQLKVQRLVIPLTIVGSATAASVSLSNDEPSIMFLQSESVNQIEDALSVGETATYSATADDSDGIMNIFIKVQESVSKVCRAQIINRVTGVAQPVKLGDANGLSSLSNIMLTLDSSDSFATSATFEYCLDVEYIVQE